MEATFYLILIALLSYLAGSLPTGVVVSRLFFGFDIRTKGSGNMGSTNAFRVLGWKWGLAVQIIDILKGVFAVAVIATYIGEGITFPNATGFEDITLIKVGAGVFAVMGHIWSFFVKFKGGKGVNTAAGMLIALVPVDVAIAFGLFSIAVILSGYISLGSITAALSIPSSLFVRHNFLNVDIPGYTTLIYFTLFIMALVLYTHRSNIKRILEGSENRFNKLRLIKLKFSSKNKE